MSKLGRVTCLTLLLLLVLIVSSARLQASTSAAEGFTVALTVLDDKDGEPIPGAIVKCPKADRGQVTDLNGHCVLTFSRQVSKALISVSYLGYKTYEKEVALSPGLKLTIRLQEDATLIQEVVVEGQLKHTTNLQQAVAIQAKDLEKGTSLNLAQLLESVPGVSSISAGSSISKPVIQGMHSSRIVLVNNGVRLESQSWGEDHAPEIDHTGASIIEVIKGAESVRYGQGALGGVVLFNQATLPFGHDRFYISGKANVGYATNGRAYDVAGSMEMGYKGWGMRLHGMYKRSGDYSTAEYGMWNTGYSNISLSGYTGYQSKSLTATLFASLYTSRQGIYKYSTVSDPQLLLQRFKVGRPDPSQIRPFSYDIEPPFQQSQHFTLKGELDWRINEDHSLETKISYQDNLRQEFENRKRDDISWLPVQDLILSSSSLDVAWEGKWSEQHSSQAGITGMYQSNFNVPGTKQPAFIPNFASLTMGAFAIHKARLDKLSASLGLRYDYRAMDVYGYTSVNLFKKYHEFKLYASVTGSAALHYQFTDNWSARANVGLAWRPPDVNELYATGIHHSTYWVVGNRDLLPEIGVKPVLGVTFRNEWLVIEPSAFYQYVHNYIYDNIGQGLDRFQDHPTGRYPRFIYEQDNAQLYGGDLMATVRPFVEGLEVTLRSEWIRGRNLTQDSWLPFMPSDRYGMGISYTRDFGSKSRWHANAVLDGQYVTKQMNFDPTKDLAPDSPPAYFLLNATAEVSYDLPHGRAIKLVFMGDNLLNALYKEYTDRFRFFAHARGAQYTLRTIIEF